MESQTEGNALLTHEAKWLLGCDMLGALFSTCAKRNYFAVILAPNKRVCGVGYNGSPPGMGHCKDGHCPRLYEETPSGQSYDNCISQHAEMGALLWSDPSLRQGGTLVVNGSPCFLCAKLIASSGISRVVFYTDPVYKDEGKVVVFLREATITTLGVTRDDADRVVRQASGSSG